MRTDASTTFEVSKVVRATKPLPEVPCKQAVEALLSIALSPDERRRVEEFLRRGHSIDLPEAPASRPVEACTRYHGRLLADVAFHPVVAAAHHAFQDHRTLRLSPDAIWLMICQAVANHVNANAEALRPRFVEHEGKVRIDVRRDDFVKGSPENPWPEVFATFSAKLRDHVGPAIDLFRPAFSTTGPAEQAAAEVVLLDALQSYFQYAFRTLCGIPEITLEGTVGDWESIAERAEDFAEFDLGRWVEVLRPILRQFVRASRGDIDAPFWRSLYKLNDQSGGPVVTGWITAFFPYMKDCRTGRATFPIAEFFGKVQDPAGQPLPSKFRSFLKDSGAEAGLGRVRDAVASGWNALDFREPGSRDPEPNSDRLDAMLYPSEKANRSGFARGPGFDSFPGGLSRAPFRWEFHDRAFEMEFLGGFVGVAQDPKTLALRPEIGWAVREVPAEG